MTLLLSPEGVVQGVFIEIAQTNFFVTQSFNAKCYVEPF